MLRALVTLQCASLAFGALPAPGSVISAMNSAAQYYQSHNALGDCGWTRGTYYAGSMAHYNVTGNKTIAALATAWAANHSWVCKDAGDPLDCNSFACGMTFARLYEIAPSDEKLALAVTMDRAINTYTGYDWWWSDCEFMGLGTYFHYAKLLNDDRIRDLAYLQYSNITFGGPKGASGGQPPLWDAPGLYHRDHTYVNVTDKNGDKVFWARGSGWVMAALAQALQHMPSTHPYAIEFAKRLGLMADALVPLQGADGFWRASLLDAALYPNPETTGTSCFTFALAWGINNGILDATKFTPIVETAWMGLATTALQSNGLVGWCQPPNGQPNPATQTDTSDFCVGQFLLAGSEVYKLAGGVPPASAF